MADLPAETDPAIQPEVVTLPEPGEDNIPVGTAEDVAGIVLSEDDWSRLDDIEAWARAVESVAESYGRDVTEARKVWRFVELRRGELAGPDVTQGERTDLREHAKVPDDASPRSVNRWRKMARHREEVVRYLFEADDKKDVTQAAVLRFIADQEEPEPQDTPGFDPGPWRTVVIDPPWPMQKIARDERPHQGSGSLDYPTWDLGRIRDDLPIPDLVDPRGAHVYLWTTHKHLPDALDLFEAWGVRYECTLTWVKNVGPTPFSWMYDTEPCLFGRAGKGLDLLKNGRRLSLRADATGHSRKPDAFFERVREVSPGPRYNLFSRHERSGFEAWGAEAPE